MEEFGRKRKKFLPLIKKMKKTKMSIWVDENVQHRYKNFCRENGLIIGKRIEGLMDADMEKRLIKIPEIKL